MGWAGYLVRGLRDRATSWTWCPTRRSPSPSGMTPRPTHSAPTRSTSTWPGYEPLAGGGVRIETVRSVGYRIVAA